MPYIFLSEEGILSLREDVNARVENLEKKLLFQKSILNSLENRIETKVTDLPEKIETDYHVVDDDTGSDGFLEPEKLCNCGLEIQPLKIPEKLKGLGKKAIEQIAAKVEQKPVKCDTLRIPAFSFDKKKMTWYQNVFFFEDEDERVAIQYRESTYYTTIPLVRLLPYPPPKAYYSMNGWNSTSEQAFKQYRKYLAEQDEQNDPDRGYKFKLKTDTKGDHGEDFEKVEGTLE